MLVNLGRKGKFGIKVELALILLKHMFFNEIYFSVTVSNCMPLQLISNHKVCQNLEACIYGIMVIPVRRLLYL